MLESRRPERSGAEAPTTTTVTVRDINPADKAWLQREARRQGISMEEYLRRLIRKERQRAKLREKPSEAFRKYFGPEHGVDLPHPHPFRFRPVEFRDEGAE